MNLTVMQSNSKADVLEGAGEKAGKEIN